MKKIIFYILLSLIFIYGIYLRYYELGTGSFWIDEGYSSIISYFSYLNGFAPYLNTERYDFQYYIFTFFQTLSFNFLGVSDFSARIPSFIFGVLNIIIVYIFSKELLKNNKYKSLGIIFIMFLFTFSTWQIIWSREARFYELLSFIYLINIYLLWKYYIDNNNSFYFLWFLIISFIGIIFHPFCFGLIFIGFLCALYKKFKKYRDISLIFIVLIIYIIIDLSFKYINIGSINISSSIPRLNNIGDYNYINYLFFYIKSIYSQLGIIFISYIFGIIYFIYNKKIFEFIIFGLIVIINIGFISYGYMAHTRYMFHIYSIITLIGGYSLVIFFNYLINNYNYKFKKTLIIASFIISIFSLYQTYSINLIPQKYYYIDFTSPKPNFKTTYKYLEENYEKYSIISGFPQLCYWYNLDNPEICSYSLRLNLVGNKNLEKNIEKNKNENYTNIKYLDNFKNIDNLNNYFFVIDDLTIKNIIDKKLLTDIKNNCNMIYKDIGNGESSNFIGIWKCR